MARHIGLTAGIVCGLVLAAPPGRAADEAAIKQAIARGVESLKRLQQSDGSWPHQQAGATSLAGLTLLECDVPPDDPAIQKAVQFVRQRSISENYTYSLSLAILFLDRLGEEADVALIQSM